MKHEDELDQLVNLPIDDLSQLHPVVKRSVEEPWRRRRTVNRPLKHIPNMEPADAPEDSQR